VKELWNRGVERAKQWSTSTLVRQYTSNTGWMMVTRAAWILSAFTVGIYVARQLGPHDFGVLNYAIALTGIFSIIASMSVEEIVIRQLVRHPERRDRELGNFFMLRLVLFAAMATTLGITLLLLHATSEVKWLCAIVACGYFGYIVQGSALYFQSSLESQFYAIPQLLACLFSSVMRAAAAYFSWSLAVFAFAEASIHLMTFGGCLLFYWRRVSSPRMWNWDWHEVWSLLRTALPLAICGVFGLVHGRIDQLMVEYFLGPAAVGYYSLATRFTENWALFSYLLCVSLFPAVITAATISADAYHKQLHRLYFLVFWCMAAAAAVTVLLSHPAILLLFGRAYLPSVPVLNVFVWTLLGTALVHVFSQWAINEKRIAMIAWAFGSAAVINVMLNPILIKTIGINGAAWSSLVSIPLGLALTLSCTADGRRHLLLSLRSIVTLPSFKLDEHAR
jgi:O-antigen/teichoic acid export membrane protein